MGVNFVFLSGAQHRLEVNHSLAYLLSCFVHFSKAGSFCLIDFYRSSDTINLLTGDGFMLCLLSDTSLLVLCLALAAIVRCLWKMA